MQTRSKLQGIASTPIKLALAGFLVFGALFSMNCGTDPDETIENVLLFNLYCPTGLDAVLNGINQPLKDCYTSCGTTFDTSGDGTIQPSEQVDYDSCTSTCDGNCSSSSILSLF